MDIRYIIGPVIIWWVSHFIPWYSDMVPLTWTTVEKYHCHINSFRPLLPEFHGVTHYTLYMYYYHSWYYLT